MTRPHRRPPRKARRGHAFRYRPHDQQGLDVIAAYGNDDLAAMIDGILVGRIGKNVIVCRDGYHFSVFAGPGTESPPRPVFSPREPLLDSGDRPWRTEGPYARLECLFPELGVVATVLIEAIRVLIDHHGGIHHLEGPGVREARRLVRRQAKLALYPAGCRYRYPHCGTPAPSPDDAANRYCGNCHRFADDPAAVDDITSIPLPPSCE